MLLLPSVSSAKDTHVLKINGNEVSSKEKPYKYYENLFVPLETISKTMGESVTLGNGSHNRLFIIKKMDGTVIKTYANHKDGVVNGKLVPLKYEEYDGVVHPYLVYATVRKGQVYVPLDFISAKRGMNYQVRQIRNNSKVTTYIGNIPKSEKLILNRKGHSTDTKTVYSTISSKSKVFGHLKKNETFYIYTSHNGRYKIKHGDKTGYITTSKVNEWKYVKPGKKYKDGWVAPVLKSEWSPYLEDNANVLRDELGFRDEGTHFSIPGKSKVIQVFNSSSDEDVTIVFYGWGDSGGALKASYRVPIVAKELFKLYFEKDATKVWNYFNKNDIPEKFTANGRTVRAYYSEATGSISLVVTVPKKR